MKPIVDLTTWLLDKDIRAKNASSFLAGLFAVVIFYFSASNSEWFGKIDRRGNLALGVALLIVFLLAFLVANLAATAYMSWRQCVNADRRADATNARRLHAMTDNLASLTDWQRGFLMKFVREDRRQIEEYEIGGYKAVWGAQLKVLVQKQIVNYLGSGMYEISPGYLQMIKDILATGEPQP